MKTTVIAERIATASPRLKARIAGVFYLLTIITGIFGEVFVRGRLIVFWRCRSYSEQHSGARSVIPVGFRSRPDGDPDLHRCDGSLLSLVQTCEQEPLFDCVVPQPCGVRNWSPQLPE